MAMNSTKAHLTFFCWNDSYSNKANKFVTLFIRPTSINSSPGDNITAIDNIVKELSFIPEGPSDGFLEKSSNYLTIFSVTRDNSDLMGNSSPWIFSRTPKSDSCIGL